MKTILAFLAVLFLAFPVQAADYTITVPDADVAILDYAGSTDGGRTAAELVQHVIDEYLAAARPDYEKSQGATDLSAYEAAIDASALTAAEKANAKKLLQDATK